MELQSPAAWRGDGGRCRGEEGTAGGSRLAEMGALLSGTHHPIDLRKPAFNAARFARLWKEQVHPLKDAYAMNA